jgi:hypothetical protein
MGVRLYSECYSTGYQGTATLYTFQIIDTAAGDPQVPVNIIYDSISFDLDTKDIDLHSRINPGKVSFTILREAANETAVNSFIADLVNHDEARFFVRIGVNGAVRFIGTLSSEANEWEDIDSPMEFTIVANCGLGRLEGINYADTSDAVYNGADNIESIIAKCMTKINTKDHYNGQPFYMIMHDKIADGQTVTGNPMSNQRVDQLVWSKRGTESNSFSYSTCQEVLEDIFIAYGLVIRYVGPYFLIYDPELYAGGTSTAYSYDVSGSYLGTATVSISNTTINNSGNLNSDRKGVSKFGVLDPYHRAIIKYDHGDQNTNLIDNLVYTGYNDSQSPDASLVELGTVTVNAGEVINLRFSGKLRTNSLAELGGSNAWRNHRYHFRLRLKVVGPYTLFWSRHFAPFDFYSVGFSWYTAPHWELGVGDDYYDIVTPIIDEKNASINIFEQIGFDTFRLDEGVSTIYFSWEIIRVFDENMNDVDEGGNPSICEWEFADLSLEAVQDGKIINRPTYTEYQSRGSAKNDLSYKATTRIGDGPRKTSIGRLQALIAGDWRDTVTWGGKKLLLTAADKILKSRKSSRKLLLGGFYSREYWTNGFVTYGSSQYMPARVSLAAGNDLWTGIWIETKTGTGGTTKTTTVMKKETVELPKNPNKLPDDERLEDRITKIVTGTDRYVKDETYDELELREAAETDLWNEGDIIWIKDPVIGYSEKITIKTDVKQGDTIVEIEPWTPDNDFPPGSYLELDTKLIIRHRYYAIDTDFSDTEWTITGWDLPDPTKWSVGTRTAEIRKRLAVTVNGQKKIYLLDIEGDRWMKGFTIDVSGVNNKIIFLEAVPDRSVVEVIYDV